MTVRATCFGRRQVPARAASILFAAATAALGGTGPSPVRADPVLTRLATFDGTNGLHPEGGVTADPAGNLYGTTVGNGGHGNDGNVYQVPAAGGPATSIYSFYGPNGRNPNSDLYADAAGNLYGTTGGGGAVSDAGGVVFKLNPATGTAATYSFDPATTGSDVVSGVVADASGNLFGVVNAGSTLANGNGGIFEIPKATGRVVLLASFPGNPGGRQPAGKLAIDAAGNLYGTTPVGGPYDNNGNDFGTVFELPAGSHSITTLVTFNGSGGAPRGPSGGVVLDRAGNLYGTTAGGGSGADRGTIFEVAAGTHAVATLASFGDGGNDDDGAFPDSGLTFDAAGDLFGTTPSGGPADAGTAFELPANSGQIRTLVAFDGYTGADPEAGLTADAAGNLYGTTAGYGLNGTTAAYGSDPAADANGTVFELTGTGFVTAPPPVTVYAGGTAHLAANAGVGILVRTLPSLTVAAGGTAVADPAADRGNRQLLVVSALSLAGTAGHWTGTLDLGNNDLDLPGASLATVTSQLAQGYAAGRWTGPGGIVSSSAAADPKRLTAVGVIQNDQGGSPLYTAANPFDGITPGASDVLVRYTYYGDANLDGVIDGADYARIDAGYNARGTSAPLTGWFNGDFNYDGRVDGSDYTLIDNAFDGQAGTFSPDAMTAVATAELTTAVPEPATVAVMAVTAAVGLGRRRR